MSKGEPILDGRPFVIVIRDGWGYNPRAEEDDYNAIKRAKTPVDDMLMSQYPNCLIHTSGQEVGLPAGTMGNSEVGHQNIGAGRIVHQESVRISGTISDGSFFENTELLNAVNYAKKSNGKIHFIGLCSDIGVHSRLEHLYGLFELAKRNNLSRVYLHALTDGRDSPPTSGAGYLAEIEKKADGIGAGQIASVMGRFYAMDRDNRWERVQAAYDCLTLGKGQKALSVEQATAESYAQEVTDEFIKPVCITGSDGNPKALSKTGTALCSLTSVATGRARLRGHLWMTRLTVLSAGFNRNCIMSA